MDIQVSGMVKSVSAYDNSLGQDYQVDVVITNAGQTPVSFDNIYVLFDSSGHKDSPITLITDERNVTLGPGESIARSYESTGSTQELFDGSKNGNIGFRIGSVSDKGVPFTASAILPRLEDKNGHEKEMEIGDSAVLIFADDKAVTEALNI
jgi:archaellum component FlaF (FlaF/FlaG flagellin family)